jgi:DNA-binding MarR family transcriptional regulator
MGKISETVNVMKKNFMALHNEGYSIAEIAERFELSPPTVYNHLDEIARENGVTRNDLLQIIKSPYSERGFREEAKRVKVDVDELNKGLAKAEESIQETIDMITMILEGEEDNDI